MMLLALTGLFTISVSLAPSDTPSDDQARVPTSDHARPGPLARITGMTCSA